MSDLFHESLTNEQIAAVFGVMAAAPRHTFQVLTKRARRMREWFGWLEDRSRVVPPVTGALSDARLVCAWEAWRAGADLPGAPSEPGWERAARGPWPLPNVHLGVSVEDQATADERIPELLACHAAVRWVSLEPQIGPVDLSAFMGGPYVALPGDRVEPSYNFGLDWIVVGGESGPSARPFDLAWARSTIAQCREANTACFVKQLGAWPVGDVTGDVTTRRALADRKGGDWNEWPADLRVRMWPGEAWT